MLVDVTCLDFRMYFMFVVRWFWDSVLVLSTIAVLLRFSVIPSSFTYHVCSNDSMQNYVRGINWWLEKFAFAWTLDSLLMPKKMPLQSSAHSVRAPSVSIHTIRVYYEWQHEFDASSTRIKCIVSMIWMLEVSISPFTGSYKLNRCTHAMQNIYDLHRMHIAHIHIVLCSDGRPDEPLKY